MAFNKDEILGILFISDKIISDFKKKNVTTIAEMAQKIYSAFSDIPKTETKTATVLRLLNFRQKPSNITEKSINNIIKWKHKGLKSLTGYLSMINPEVEKFCKKKQTKVFFEKWDSTNFKIAENEYSFPIQKVEAFLKKKKTNENDLKEKSSNNMSTGSISIKKSQIVIINAQDSIINSSPIHLSSSSLGKLKKISFKKEDLKNEWLVYEISFLWHNLEPPSIATHWEYLNNDRDLYNFKKTLHDLIDQNNLKACREIKDINEVVIQRYISRETLIDYAKSINEKPKFLFKEIR